jgi:hypothetical protein
LGPTGPVSSDGLAWPTYIPTWTAASSNPVIGNGSLIGRVKQIGKTTFISIKLTIGSSTTFGSGYWKLTLPFNAVNADSVLLKTIFYKSSGTTWYQGLSWTSYDGNTSYIVPLLDQGATGSAAITSIVPFTWATGDTLTITGSYEAV